MGLLYTVIVSFENGVALRGSFGTGVLHHILDDFRHIQIFRQFIILLYFVCFLFNDPFHTLPRLNCLMNARLHCSLLDGNL